MTLQNLDIDDFLAHYWQQKPLLIRQAFANFKTVISPEELAGLACDEDVFSRLLLEQGGAKAWQLINGPFKEEDFLNLPETHYSLLVSECEKWLPELTDIVDQFHFLPQWRIDDLMISYAPKQGSVGAHVDQYDVFLLQAHGQRHWHIQSPDSLDPTLVDGLDIALLKNFKHDEDWVLNPGDMLYLPAGVPHHGIALDPCMTYSIGFRAPSSKEILEGVIDTLSHTHQINDSTRYTDPQLDTKRHPSEITCADINQVQQLINQAANSAKHLLPQISGELMTKKSLDLDLACNVAFDTTPNTELERHPDALLAYHLADDELLFFCNGHCHHLKSDLLDTVQFICEQRHFIVEQLPNNHFQNSQTLLDNLVRQSLLLIT